MSPTRIRGRRFLQASPVLILSLVCLSVLAPSRGFALWGRYSRPLIAPEKQNGLGAVLLDQTVYSHARADLADLRVVNAEGESIPAVLLPPGPAEGDPRLGQILNQVTRGSIREAVIDLGEAPVTHDHIKIDFDSSDSFVADVSIDGSDDGRDWGALAEHQVLARISSEEGQVEVSALHYPACRFRFLRLRWYDRLSNANLTVSVADLPAASRSIQLPQEWPVRVKQYDSEDGQEQIVEVFLPGPMPAEEIELDIDTPAFFRYATVSTDAESPEESIMAEENLFRYGVAGTTAQQLTIPLREVRSPLYRIAISRGDDPPLVIRGVHVKGRADRLAFDPSGQTGLRLCYGVSDARRMRHDLEEIVARTSADNFTEWRLGLEETSSQSGPFAVQGEPWWVWVAVTGVVLLLAGGAVWVMSRLKTIGEG